MRALRAGGWALLLASCYSAPPLAGLYRCNDSSQCGGESWVCDDGYCCVPGGLPWCPTLVLDGGFCPDGGTAKTYFPDCDSDGYGDQNDPHLFCRQPSLAGKTTDGGSCAFITQGGDCNDNPAAGGAQVHPGAQEICDGLDNNCNGGIDEGLPVASYFADQDSDGYGDPNTMRIDCKQPRGYVTDNSDCGPLDPEVHPGAPERCNGIDDDCNGAIDDNPVGTGDPCTDPTRKGVCANGKLACVNANFVCGNFTAPSNEVCDGLDNDCNGLVDEPPGCGGPTDLLNDPSVGRGAQDTGCTSALWEGGCVPSGCGKGIAGSVAEPWNDSTKVWSPTGYHTHLFYAQTNGAPWDLTGPGTHHLVFDFNYSINSTTVNGSYGPWYGANEPTLRLCGPNGQFVIYVPSPTYLNAGSGTIQLDVPLAGNYTSPYWTAGLASIDMSKVYWVELMIQPESATPPATISVTVTQAGFR